ncbi:type II secretion system F family protein [Gilliamella mensalis]|uniref:type II secretion system F family protein n=1 Tax=Gilliamella mensalis TaxID=1908520 RepID=UPI000A16465C|nr:type II secretion system F family protein [Gilliamella mensalis]
MIFILSIVLVFVAIMRLWEVYRRKERLRVFDDVEIKKVSLANFVEEQLAQRKSSFGERISFSFILMIRTYYNLLTAGQTKIRLFMYILAGTIIGTILNQQYTNYSNYIAVPLSTILTTVIIFFIKKKKLTKEFYETFPEVLNIITGAVSSGNAITTSFNECGNMVEGTVGRTMKEIHNRLEIGEGVESVLLSSYVRLPFPEYYFFILTIMVNIDSGGELKDILGRLAKMLTNNRILTKTRDSKTAELRMTMMILGGMPFAFLFMLKWISRMNYEYLVNTTVGSYILYYVVGSVAVGYLVIKRMINKII